MLFEDNSQWKIVIGHKYTVYIEPGSKWGPLSLQNSDIYESEITKTQKLHENTKEIVGSCSKQPPKTYLGKGRHHKKNPAKVGTLSQPPCTPPPLVRLGQLRR